MKMLTTEAYMQSYSPAPPTTYSFEKTIFSFSPSVFVVVDILTVYQIIYLLLPVLYGKQAIIIFLKLEFLLNSYVGINIS